MKAIQIRDVPEETHRTLRGRAAAAGMSLQEYLLATLKRLADMPTVEEVVQRASGRSGGRVGLAKAAAQLREERTSR